jgi:pimeloyl-ACP methyl ester carboxylesterase
MTGDVSRTDHRVPSEPGVEIFVREVRAARSDRGPIVLVHGGGPGGVASFDLPVPGYSLGADLASAGHTVDVMDVRGWAGSSRPPGLARPASENPPAVRSEEVVRDIGAVVGAVQAARVAHGGDRVALLGWATGGHWCAMYTAQHPEAVSHLVMLNSLYGVDALWELRAAFEAEDRPGEFDRNAGAYALRTAAGLLRLWDRSIPADDKSEWRDPVVAERYVDTALASDPLSETHTPPAMRTPSGFQLDSYEMSRGWRPWQASDLRVPTLVIRGERDFWSRPRDLEALGAELVSAPRARTVTIPDGTHHLFNDRPERGRTRFLEEVTSFLAAE